MVVLFFVHLQQLAVQGDFAHSESWSGPDPDLDPDPNNQQHHADADSALQINNHQTPFHGKGEQTKGALQFSNKSKSDSVVYCTIYNESIYIAVQKEESDADTQDGNQFLEFDSARNSFSLALKGSSSSSSS